MKKTVKSIPTSKFARGFRLAKLTASVGASSLTEKMAGFFSEDNKNSRLISQIKQAQKVAETLSQMKGAAMKLGQILSIHGEHLFPKEIVEILSTLQQHSIEMDFAELEKVLKKELGERYALIEKNLSRDPIASASIGQVHLSDFQGKKTAIKIQYPGVDQSIDSDIDSLAQVLGLLTRLPQGVTKEAVQTVTDEIKTILHLETDYLQEGENLKAFRRAFSLDENSSVIVPEFFSEISSKHVLSTEFIEGLSVQDFADSTASQKARSFLGKNFLEVFYRELFDLQMVQTDPNFANYKIQWKFGISEPKLVLLDFGAVKRFEPSFIASYKRAMRACLDDDYEGIRESAVAMGFLNKDDPKELVDLHYELVRMFMEPFEGVYKNSESKSQYVWNESDLPERIRKFIPKFIMAFKLRPPPKDFIFLNRKIVGIYFFCSAIKAEFNPRPILEKFIL